MLNITINGATTPYTLADGEFELLVLEVSEGDNLELSWIQNGDFPEEISYTLFDSEGNSLLEVSNPDVSDTSFTTAVSCASCAIPIDLQTSNILATEATLSWRGSDTATNGYSITVTLTGDDPDLDPVQQLSAMAGEEELLVTDLTAETTYDFYIRARCTDEESQWAGPASFTTTPVCQAPAALSVDFVGNTFVQLSWTPVDNAASGYELLAYLSGVNTETGTPQVTASLPAGTVATTLNGLNAETNYDLYIRSDCGGEGVSGLSAAEAIFTLCDPVSAPLVQTFDTNITPVCWRERGEEAWQYNQEPDYDALDAPDHTSGSLDSNAFAWIDSSVNENGDRSTLASPLVDVSALENPIISFWVFSSNSNEPNSYNTLEVSVFDGAALSVFTAINQQTQGEAGWQQFVINLGADFTVSGPVQVLFTNITTASGSPFFNDILIDDVSIEESFCIDPEITASAISESSVQLDWNDIDFDPDGYRWAVFAAGSDPLTATPVQSGQTATNETNVIVSELVPGTAYEAYVIANCEAQFLYDPAFFVTIGNCDSPQNTEVMPTGPDTAALTWEANANGASGYEYVVVNAGDNPYSDTPVLTGVVDAVTFKVKLNGLLSNTSYEAFVRALCDPQSAGTSVYGVAADFSTFISCGQDFFDSGGPNGNYGDGENEFYYFGPDQPGQSILLEFTQVDLEANFDYLEVYEGIGTGGTQLSAEVTGPATFISTAEAGTLTVVFRSDVSFNRSGWEAQVSCVLANDDCDAAVTLNPKNNFEEAASLRSTLTAGNSSTTPTPTCGGFDASSRDIFFEVTVPDSGNLTIETQAGGEQPLTGTALSVYTGNCGSLVEILCDDGGGLDAFAKAELSDLTPGTLLTVRVFGAGTGGGEFSIGAYDESILSLDDRTLTSLQFYPNPVKDFLYLQSEQPLGRVKLYDLSGKLLFQQQVETQSFEIPFQNLSSGMYLLETGSGDRLQRHRILKR
ncbi:fibronectin type III domain-containing protein [Croceiramulus getboli]|nr:fibronectin type III domain-containing protein [Flavobacteriaceae bacterium YJPT1-3]